jgi:hypothetical protein
MKELLSKINFQELDSNAALHLALFCLLLISIPLIKSVIADLLKLELRPKLEKLENALKSELIKGCTRIVLENELVREHFRICTGISREKEFREAMLNDYLSTRGEVDFIHFKRALMYLDYKDSKLQIEITEEHRKNYKHNRIIAFVYFCCALFFMAITLVFWGSLNKMLYSFGLVMFCFFFSIYITFKTVMPFESAEKIKEYLQKIRVK